MQTAEQGGKVLRLHDNLSSGNGYKACLLLARLAIPFERVEYDIDSGQTRTPEFLENVNPNGRIPVLETEDGRLLPESNAILCYLAEGSPLVPNDRFGRAQVLRWMFFEQYSHEPNTATPRYWITHGLEMTEERRATLEPKRRLGYAALRVMEGHLTERAFFVGDRYSVADIALYAYTPVAPEGASTWMGSRRCAPGWIGSRPNPTTSPSRRARPERSAFLSKRLRRTSKNAPTSEVPRIHLPRTPGNKRLLVSLLAFRGVSGRKISMGKTRTRYR